MTDITQLIQSGQGHVWLYIPVAILLGALHGLEPGHSKTMMAAFIIAVRGTIAQAVLLGLSAAISHSLIIWVLAALALNYGSKWNAESIEPMLQIVSGVMILGLAAWMYFRTRREVQEAAAHGHGHGHTHHHDATPNEAPQHEVVLNAPLLSPERLAALAKRREQSAPAGVMIDTGHGWLRVAIFEDGVPPRFRIYPCKASGEVLPLRKGSPAATGTRLTIETARIDGSTQLFKFESEEGYWESVALVPEPHEFAATLTMGHEDHAHTYRLRFVENHEHNHATVVEEVKPEGEVYQDAHERAHAEDIAKRFANRSVTTPQIVLFGITGGLMPCPAAFTILLVCLQLKRATLGFAIVGAFSFGLALTMVSVGAAAAWSVQHAQKRFSGFGDAMRKAPYVSCALLTLLASYMIYSGVHGLGHAPKH